MEPASGWQLNRSSGAEFYEFSPAPGLVLAFFTRNGGTSHPPYHSLNLSDSVGDKPECVDANRRLAGQAVHLPLVFTVRQIHSDIVIPIRDRLAPVDKAEADALFTTLRGVGLGVKVADCLPVYIWCRDLSGIGIAHCGWRGTKAGIAPKLARAMSRHLSKPLPDFGFSTGPCICPSCYEVGEDVREEFRTALTGADRFFTELPAGKLCLDLRAANRSMLLESGLAEAPALNLCTSEHPDYCFSVRREARTGRNLAAVSLRR